MAPSPAPPVVPWRTTMRERHLSVPRATAWAVLIGRLGDDPADLSVEPPWRHVRRLSVPGNELCEQAVTLRDDGDECHLAGCVGLSADVDDTGADAVLERLAGELEALLEAVAGAVRS